MSRPLTAADLQNLGLAAERIGVVLAALEAAATASPGERWQRLTAGPLTSDVPFAVHARLYDHVFADWDDARGPRPAWLPTAPERTNIAALMRARGLARYEDLHAWSVRDRPAFWRAALDHLDVKFRQPPTAVLDASGGAEHPRWLPGARYNIVESCLAADPNAPAIVWGAPDGSLATISYGALATEIGRVQGALAAAGFRAGDALAIDMPMTPEAVFIYLGVVASGMAVVSVADSLAAEEVMTRLRIAGAVGLFTAQSIDRGGKQLPLYPKLLAAPDLPRAIVIGADPAGLRPGDLAWSDFLGAASDRALAPVVGDPDTITNVLFSSGTTGEPKAIPWTQLTPLKAAIDGAFHLDIQPGDVVAWPTNLGWMMGPWLIYASLLNRATMALFFDAPLGRTFGEFVARARVNVLGLVPSIVKAWRTDDRMRGLDWSALKCFGSTGEASGAGDYLYLMMLGGYCPVIEYCGGTEIGGGYITGTLVQPASPATFSTPALGTELVLLDEAGQPADRGEVFLVPPTLGYSQRLLNRDHHEIYFAGAPTLAGQVLRRHGDELERLGGGYYRALGRVDDTMNLGGIKVSSAEIERVLDTVPGVQRTAAIAVNPPGGGPSELVIYAVATETAAALLPRLQQAIKQRLNPLFRISDLVLIAALPVTASNKIMRRELRAQYRRAG